MESLICRSTMGNKAKLGSSKIRLGRIGKVAAAVRPEVHEVLTETCRKHFSMAKSNQQKIWALNDSRQSFGSLFCFEQRYEVNDEKEAGTFLWKFLIRNAKGRGKRSGITTAKVIYQMLGIDVPRVFFSV